MISMYMTNMYIRYTARFTPSRRKHAYCFVMQMPTEQTIVFQKARQKGVAVSPARAYNIIFT